MSDHLIEQEQVEQIKQFLRTYGKPIIAGVVVGLLIMFGWRYYQAEKALMNAQASAAYEKLLRDVNDDNAQAIHSDATQLIKEYKSTPYAQQASFILARQAVYDGDYDAAIEHLQWVLDEADQPSMRQAARLRLARVLSAKQRYDEALQIITKVEDPAFQMAVDEVQGDILLAKGDHRGAQLAYQAALSQLKKADFNYPLLQMKYDDLTGETSVPGQVGKEKK
jgi:predicted negative regulator of RcsB-dependent stress response